MAEKRMIRRDIYESSVMANLAEKSPDLELEAQRIFTTLILLADDYGRGRLLPIVIRAKAFASTANAITKVTVDNVKEWIDHIEAQGAIEVYEVDGDKYYRMSGWDKYQDGKWYKRDSLLPPSPHENLGKTSELSLEKVDQVKLSKAKIREEKKDLPPVGADKKTPAVKKKGVPIEDRVMKHPPGKIVQQWFRKYLQTHEVKWTGDIAKMGGQAKTLLKSHSYDNLLASMCYLFDTKDRYRPHEWDFYVRKISTLIVEAQEKGYFT